MAEVKKVFLSSTGRDLSEYRKAAYKAMEGLEGYHCVRMEDFGARNWGADRFCRKKVGECDLFVGILGLCYGSSPKGKQKSYTEREYEAAIAAKLPRLMFLAPDDFLVPGDLIESDEERAKQKAFRDRVSAELVRDTFTSPEDLAWRVERAIFNWALGEQEAKPEAAAGPAALVPLPPQAYFVHPYPLQRNFTGRVKERSMLSQWLVSGEEPVMAMIAIGGMGKSAMTWAWVQRDVLGLPLPGAPEDPCDAAEACRVAEANKPEGVFWYSFYEREATFQNFLDAALAYCSGGKVDPASVPSIHERMQALYDLLCGNQFLLMLDGVERILRAYASLDAAYQGDAVQEDERGDFRSCTDPNAGTFLRWLGSGAMKSGVAITSRLFPRELDDMGGCRREDLEGFDTEDARIFFQNLGIECTRAEVEDVCRPYGYQPLALRLLAGLITEDPERPNDISVVAGEKITEDLRGKEQHHVLERAYNALGKGERELLSGIAAFRSPVEYDVLKSLFGPGKKKRKGAKVFRFKGEKELKDALKGLVKRGLLLRQEGTGRYDLHPIVRQYAYDRLADKEGTHTRFRDYFSAVPTPQTEKVEKIEDLNPVIELYHHTIRAGRYDEARQLYRNRLTDLLYFRFGAYQTCIELLRALFPDGEDKPPRLKEESDQALTLNALANSYGRSGQSRRAVPLFEGYATISEKRKDKLNLAIGLGNLAQFEQPLGELAAAEKNLRRSIELCREAEDEFEEAVSHQELGCLLAYKGDFDEAAHELKTSTACWKRRNDQQGVCLDEAYRALRALLIGDARGGLDAARRAHEIAISRRNELDVIRAEWLLGWAKVGLALEAKEGMEKLLAEAEGHLTEALTRCRRINMIDHEPDILLTWARWQRGMGNAGQASEDAGEALRIADRCEYRLVQADCHNFLARLAMDEGNREEAKKEAEKAYRRGWCDGPPHCYKPALDEAERMLKELGAELPKMG